MLYLTLGDTSEYDGVWMSKLKDGSDRTLKAASKDGTNSTSYPWIGIEHASIISFILTST
jgi:hypothetical protein